MNNKNFELCYIANLQEHIKVNTGTKWETPIEQFTIDSTLIYQINPSGVTKSKKGSLFAFFTSPDLLVWVSVSKDWNKDISAQEEVELSINSRNLVRDFLKSVKACK